MATYGDLKARIAAELVRDDFASGGDMESILINAVKSAIKALESETWWFLTTTVTAPTVTSQNYITRPATIAKIRRASIPTLGRDLERVDLAEIEFLDEPAAQTGQPLIYAEGEAGAQLRLWPTPNAIFTVKLVGTKLIPDMAEDEDETVWTNEAYDLVTAIAKKRLFRSPLRDDAGWRDASAEEAEARQVLLNTNTERFDAPVCPAW